MKISVITISYNCAKTIRRSINSVISQDYNDMEYIIIDGGSTDGTKEIIEEYKNYISKYVSEKDNGIYDAINKGISFCKGDIIGILHSDDIFNRNDILKIIATEFRKRNIDGLYGDLVYVNENNKVVRNWKTYRLSLITFI